MATNIEPSATTGEATVTIRCIRSFEHRNVRNLVLRNVQLDLSTSQLLEKTRAALQTASNIPPPFKKYPFDTFKIETQAFGFKTNDPLIRKERDDELILKDGVRLSDSGVKNETEISFFKLEDYLKYKENPITTW